MAQDQVFTSPSNNGGISPSPTAPSVTIPMVAVQALMGVFASDREAERRARMDLAVLVGNTAKELFEMLINFRKVQGAERRLDGLDVKGK